MHALFVRHACLICKAYYNVKNVCYDCYEILGSKIKEKEGKPSETDSIKFKISSKTPRGKKDSTKRHHHRHHKRQPGEQQFPKQVVTG